MSSFASCSPNNKAGGQISGGGCPFAYFAHGQTSATNSPMRSRDTSPMPSRGGTIASPSLSQSNYVFKSSASRNFSIDNWVVENQRLVGLYEDFIHFEPVRNAWYNTSTESHTDGTNISIKPELMSTLHGIEACMAVLSVFLNDKRPYVCKRSRIDMVCRDIFTQSMLLCNWHKEFEVCWNHCAFDTSSGSGSTSMNAMKSNSFQPTHGCASNGLYLLQQSLERNFADFSVADKCAAKMLVERLCVAFISIKLTYKTNLDVEAQLERISNIVGHNFIGNVLSDDAKTVNYACISQSHVIGTTLSCENYEHPEDFFFRTMHLVTECWAVVHNNYLDVAFEAAVARDWLCASEIIDRCNDVLNYMGDHMLLLCSMNLKDYLIYKPEIAGASGEGSVAVKTLRSKVVRLMEPLHSYAVAAGRRDADKARLPLHDRTMTNAITPKASSLLGEEVLAQMSPDDICEMDALADIYYHPEISEETTAVYCYCKSLEFAETALLSGFYHKHFELAANVIGSLGKGTLTRNVQALRASHSASCFAVLDVIRYTIATPFDDDLAARKGNLINGYAHKRGWPLVPNTDFPVPPLVKGISVDA